MTAHKTMLSLRHHQGSLFDPPHLVMALALFAAGMIAGISAAPLLFPPAPEPAAQPAVVTKRPEQPVPAAPKSAADVRYRGIVAAVSDKGLTVAVPDLRDEEGEAVVVVLTVDAGTKLTAVVPKTPDEIAKEVGGAPPAGWDESKGLPPPPPQPDEPYKIEARVLADLKADDVVEFVTFDPLDAGTVYAESVTWIATLRPPEAPPGDSPDGRPAPTR